MTLQEALDSVSAKNQTEDQVTAQAEKYKLILDEVAKSEDAKQLVTCMFASALPQFLTDPVAVLLMAFGSGVMIGTMMGRETSAKVN